MNSIDLTERHAIVTGGAQGIGLAIAHRLVESGATVTLWDLDEEMLLSARQTFKNQTVMSFCVVDVTDPMSLEHAVTLTLRRHEHIDILITSAGIAGSNHALWDYPVDMWRKVIEINLTGTFLSCRAVLPSMLRQNYGRIVTIASIAGKEGNPNASAYSASKAGVIAMTKSVGKETAGHNISINCITPAAAQTRIFDQMTQEHIDFMLSKIPRARFLKLNEISAMVSWLVSEENSFTTGAVFDLSGGRATY